MVLYTNQSKFRAVQIEELYCNLCVFVVQGLREMKDNAALYTNRAQTYIKLGKFPEAFLDCEWALKVRSCTLIKLQSKVV